VVLLQSPSGGMALDDTQALLDLADEEAYPLRPVQDSSEDEVFVGTPKSKEKKGNRRSRRDTLDQAEVGDFRRAQLDRSSLSLLSSDNTIAEEEEDVLQDCEVSSSFLGDLPTGPEDKALEAKDREHEAEDKDQELKDIDQEAEDQTAPRANSMARDRGSSEDWETESETSVLDPSLSEATEMEVSIDISGIARLPPSRHPSWASCPSTTRSGVYDSFSDDTQEVVVEETEEEEEVVLGGSRKVTDEEEEYLKDLQYIARSEAEGDTEEESGEEEEEAEVLEGEEEEVEKEKGDQVANGGEEQEEEEVGSGSSLPRVEVTRPSCGPDTSISYYSAASSPWVSQVAQTSAEPTFDTTVDEMILYEMFGDDYDDRVEAMSAEERRRLQEEVNTIKQKESARQLRQRLQERLGSASSLPDSVGSAVSPFSLGANTPSPTPSPAPSTFSPAPSPTLSTAAPSCRVSGPSLVTMEEERPVHREGKVTPPRRNESEFLVPKSQDRLATYSAPTLSSLHRRASPSPAKTPSSRPAWVPASPIPGKELSLSPLKAVPRVRPPSRLPMPVTRHLASPALLSLRQDSRAVQNQVSSPVANYVKSNPAPPLVRNVVAKETARDLESTLMEVDQEDQENCAPPASCPLPANTYRPAARRQETRTHRTQGQQYEYIPEAYGQAYSGAEASVTRHLRRKVTDQASPLPSPRSSLEMSVLETKVVRTFATPLPRTANH